MKKHRGKIIVGLIIITLLIIAFFCSGDVTTQNVLVSEPDYDTSIAQGALPQKEMLTVEEDVVETTVPVVEPDKTESEQNTIPEVDNNENPEEHSSENQPTETEISTEINLESNAPSIEIEEIADANKDFTCILSVRCDTILNNTSHLNSEKLNIVPQNGIIFPETTVTFYEGESVFNVLVREMKRSKIHLEFEMSPIYETAYIKGIANLYEFDCGDLSGWLYKVNGQSTNVGCSLYKLKDGDKIEWIYTCG